MMIIWLLILAALLLYKSITSVPQKSFLMMNHQSTEKVEKARDEK